MKVVLTFLAAGQTRMGVNENPIAQLHYTVDHFHFAPQDRTIMEGCSNTESQHQWFHARFPENCSKECGMVRSVVYRMIDS